MNRLNSNFVTRNAFLPPRWNRMGRLVCGLLVLGVVGCGRQGPQLAPVSGKITLGDKPVPYATVTFIPAEGTGAGPSSGVTDEQGRYRLGYSRDQAGAFVGKHDVLIKGLEANDEASRSALKESGIDLKQLPVVPKKYLKAGELHAEVRPGSNDIDFRLE